MAKELTHRSDELVALGWSQEDVARYAELWEYRQRWGAINLERDDRQFLRKAETVLPKISTGKVSVKKPLKEKSYYRWLSLFLEAMNKAESSFHLEDGDRGVWPILLEEELRTLDYYQPVLGLPDTLKAKAFVPIREQIAARGTNFSDENSKSFEFDFQAPLNDLNTEQKGKWRPLRDDKFIDETNYIVLKASKADAFREEVRSEIVKLIKETFPSLADTDKPDPPSEWIQE